MTNPPGMVVTVEGEAGGIQFFLCSTDQDNSVFLNVVPVPPTPNPRAPIPIAVPVDVPANSGDPTILFLPLPQGVYNATVSILSLRWPPEVTNYTVGTDVVVSGVYAGG